MNDWDDFGFEDTESYKRDLSGVSVEELQAELANRGVEGFQSLAKMRQRIEVGRCSKDGVFCPLCDQKARNQKRPFNRNMGQAAALLWRAGGGSGCQWVHMPSMASRSIVKAGGDWSIAKYWGLCEPKINTDEPKKKHTGWWRATPKLGQFLCGEITIPKFVVLYNSTLLHFEGEQIRFTDPLPEFDFSAYMAEAGTP